MCLLPIAYLAAVRWSERGTARTLPAAPATTTTTIPHTPGPSGTYQDSATANFSFPRNLSVSFQHIRDLLTLPLRTPWLLNRLWGYRAACRGWSAGRLTIRMVGFRKPTAGGSHVAARTRRVPEKSKHEKCRAAFGRGDTQSRAVPKCDMRPN